jgi:peptidoglycan hydrolase-like protein with peptidoglycan-binding domain
VPGSRVRPRRQFVARYVEVVRCVEAACLLTKRRLADAYPEAADVTLISRMTRIFISYARQDLHAAQKVASLLEERGWDVWWDRDLIAGDRFDQVIEQQLASAAAVIVLWSRASVASEWVRSEASVAAERRALVPAAIDHTPVPLRFRMLHTVDLSSWPGDAGDENFERLVTAVQALAGPPPPRATLLPPPTSGPVVLAPTSGPVVLPPPPDTAGEAVTGTLDGPATQPRRPHRARWIGLAAVVLAVVGALATVLLRAGDEGATAEPSAPATTTAAPTASTDDTRPDDTSPEDTLPDPTVLQRGSNGDDVAQVQQWLRSLGFELAVDGVFGPKTEGAVEEFEQSYGLDVDGRLVIGEEDWELLRAAAAEFEPVDGIVVPDIYQWPADLARAELEALGFEVDEDDVCSSSVGEGEVRQVVWLDHVGDEHVVVDKPGGVADDRAPAANLLKVKVGDGSPCS